MTEPKRRGRPPKNPVPTTDPNAKPDAPTVDWELLSKRLQEALQLSVDENKVLFNDNCKLVNDNRNLMAIVKYLESRLDRANDSI